MYDLNQIYEPTSLMDLLQMKQAHREALPLAGGTDILIKIREGKLAGKSFIDLNQIDALKGISKDDTDTIWIGPLTTFSQLTDHPIIKRYLPTLGEAVDQVGGPQIRNRGTLGGNICNGVTSADSASTLLTYNAELVLMEEDPSTHTPLKRILPLESFYKGPGKVDLSPTEVLTALCIKKENYEGFFGHYIKYAMRQAMDIATLGCAVNVKLDETKDYIQEARLAFGVAGPVPMRCPLAEAAVKGLPLTASTLRLFSETAQKEVNPRTSWRASKDFRLHLVATLSHLALTHAIHLGGGHLHD